MADKFKPKDGVVFSNRYLRLGGGSHVLNPNKMSLKSYRETMLSPTKSLASHAMEEIQSHRGNLNSIMINDDSIAQFDSFDSVPVKKHVKALMPKNKIKSVVESAESLNSGTPNNLH